MTQKSDSGAKIIRSQLLKVCFDGGKWCEFKCLNLETNEKFTQCRKLWCLHDTCIQTNINISRWDDYFFADVVKLIILMEKRIVLVWAKEDCFNYFPDHFEGAVKDLKRRIRYLRHNNKLLDTIESSYPCDRLIKCSHCKRTFKNDNDLQAHEKAKSHGFYKNNPIKYGNASKKEIRLFNRLSDDCTFSITQ